MTVNPTVVSFWPVISRFHAREGTGKAGMGVRLGPIPTKPDTQCGVGRPGMFSGGVGIASRSRMAHRQAKPLPLT